jgi:hypothetical protein
MVDPPIDTLIVLHFATERNRELSPPKSLHVPAFRFQVLGSGFSVLPQSAPRCPHQRSSTAAPGSRASWSRALRIKG